MTLDPVPAGYVTLDEALRRLATELADQDVHLEKNQRRLCSAIGLSPEVISDDRSVHTTKNDNDRGDRDAARERMAREGTLAWAKRELAVWDLHAVLAKGALPSFVRDPTSGDIFQIPAADWRMAFARETIIGGVVQALPGEAIERYAERVVLIQTAVLEQWLKERPRRPIAAANDSLSWLKNEMLQNPDADASPHPKAWYRDQAKMRFGLTSEREFDRLWSRAKTETSVEWGAGRRKSPQ